MPPEVGSACELGFGQGMSANLHAAASVVQWSGTDFNPAQAAFAQELARVAESGAQLFDEAFDQFGARADLPEFDYIGLHGIWSWISDENRAVIVDFIRRKLKVGGVLYISYNTLPGWSGLAPVRHLMTQHAALLGADGQGSAKRIDSAVEFAQQVLATQPLYLGVMPHAKTLLDRIAEQDRHYLAHEYFNRDWHPMYFADMQAWLQPAKLSFACSAHYLDLIDAVNITPEQQQFLQGIPEPGLRETVRDYMTNQKFRRDYWVKGARPMNTVERLEAFRAQRLVLVSYRPDIKYQVTGARGEANLTEAVYAPILDYLADHRAHTIGELEQRFVGSEFNFGQLLQVLMILAGAGHLMAAQDEATIAQVKPNCDRLNRHLMRKARGSADVVNLASPVTGGGVPVVRFYQLFLLSAAEGGKTPADWANFVWKLLASQGQNLVKEDKPLLTPEENLAELTRQAENFAGKHLPILQALQIV